MELIYNGVRFICNVDIPEDEAHAYVEYIQKKCKSRVETVSAEIDGEWVNINYKCAPASFERIRRITGYLVGTLDRFNDAKRAEEHDRVKHSVS